MVSKQAGSAEGKRLRHLRSKAELTQEDLAGRVGVARHTIWRLEKGPAFNPRLRTIQAIAKALGVDVGYLLSAHPPKS
ncbi:MAG TPA: helix-turn-helix transcriptional regulator [Candidatus Dormibacteraeota bacterium]|nr:helix-turn-helix transcriptional regulator [Candidatus Dormibacteraeota bacterium]